MQPSCHSPALSVAAAGRQSFWHYMGEVKKENQGRIAALSQNGIAPEEIMPQHAKFLQL